MTDNDVGKYWGSEGWEPVAGHKASAGGQATVQKVMHRSTDRVGALKMLHTEHLNSRERRFRMQQEVQLLNLLEGKGVPRVLASNVDAWKEVGTPLYLVAEWIDGPTLANFCGGKPQGIDTTLAIVIALTDVVRQFHRVEVIHRDIKPDNIILKGGATGDPILVDFGMGWAAQDNDDGGEFQTTSGQELGNRFLRLPEYSPGNHVRDSRSDVTMLVAVLLYLLTGAAPRVLADPNGRMPHESMGDRFPGGTTSDPRWERIRRIFTVGFQYRIDMRYSDVERLASALASISEMDAPDSPNSLDRQLARIRDLEATSDAALLDQLQLASLDALTQFQKSFLARLPGLGFIGGGNNPTVATWGRACEGMLGLRRSGAQEPSVTFVHRVSFENGQYEAMYSVVGESIWTIVYKGPLADKDSLRDGLVKSVDAVIAALLERYATAYESYLTRMRK